MLFEFEHHQQERFLLGSMLISYGEFEFNLACLVEDVLKVTTDEAARLLFRVRGEGARIDVADALIRPAMARANLGGKWGNVYGALKHCKKIRNQYAHCHWQNIDNNLYFLDFDQDAQSPADEVFMLRYHGIDLPLLEAQIGFFEYTSDLLYYLSFEYRKFAHNGKVEWKEPKSVPQPPLYNRAVKGEDLRQAPKDDKTAG